MDSQIKGKIAIFHCGFIYSGGPHTMFTSSRGLRPRVGGAQVRGNSALKENFYGV